LILAKIYLFILHSIILKQKLRGSFISGVFLAGCLNSVSKKIKEFEVFDKKAPNTKPRPNFFSEAFDSEAFGLESNWSSDCAFCWFLG